MPGPTNPARLKGIVDDLEELPKECGVAVLEKIIRIRLQKALDELKFLPNEHSIQVIVV